MLMHERFQERMCTVVERLMVWVTGNTMGIEGDDSVDVGLWSFLG